MRRMPMRLQKLVKKNRTTPRIVGSKSAQLDQIYYINLDRREDRHAHFLEQCRIANLDTSIMQRFAGIDGRTFTPTVQEEQMFARCSYKDSPHCRKIMANQLSHYYILQDMMARGHETVLILQDDVVFKSHFNHHLDNVLRSLPEDAEIVNIGMHKFAAYADFEPIALEDNRQNKTPCKRRVNPYICEIQDAVNPCSLAYLVTKKGCRNLIQHFQQNGFEKETDINYNNYLRGKRINYASSLILSTGALLGSDVWA